MKVLLHSCCAPCASGCINELRKQGLEPALYYCDSNIFPKSEWQKRLKNLEKISASENVSLIVEEYDHESWKRFVAGLEGELEGGKRCSKCFEYRLEKAAKEARANGFDCFTTTLTVAPMKKSEKIFAIGDRIAAQHGVRFLKIDFKKNNGFKKSVEESKRLGLYRQNYCGCEFSLRENRQASPKE
jgi:predicted adenine nucleotide alpha hydrolase (AANH) superfamily ATPase